MRVVVQRVTKARVTVDGELVGSCGQGLVALIGFGQGDTQADVRYIVDKLVNLRIFPDASAKMNLSVKEVAGSMLAVSQFTLYGDCRQGRRPGFSTAAPPEKAIELYNKFIDLCQAQGVPVETGCFQTNMLVEIHNDGPVTLLIDSKKEF
jgi:D-tyrosyl-tRNA(Tyr) deacylase